MVGQEISLRHVNELLKAIETLEAGILNKQIRSLEGGDEHSGDFMFSLLENANVRFIIVFIRVCFFIVISF